MDRPRDPNASNSYDSTTDRPSDVSVRQEGNPDLFGQDQDSQSQSMGGLTQSQTANPGGLGGSTEGLDSIAGIQGDEASPDTGLYGSGDNTLANEVQDNAADVIMGASGDVATPPETEGTNSDPGEPNAVDTVTYEGKKVFSPHELNQSGEDKEYFPPEKGHRFEPPQDANDHALTPDIEVTPDGKIGRVE